MINKLANKLARRGVLMALGVCLLVMRPVTLYRAYMWMQRYLGR